MRFRSALIPVGLGVAAAASLTLTPLAARRADEKAARVPLEAYMSAHRSGNADVMASAFHPTARMVYATDTGIAILPMTEYVARMRANPKAAPDTFPRKITMVDVNGTAAVGRIDMDLGTVVFSDYMTVLKFPDGWKIVNKSFHRETRAAR